MPVMADESCYTLQDAMALTRAGAADILSVYVGKGGGIGPARKMAAVAEAAGLTCTVGSNLELGIASAAMAHLATATPGIGAEEFPCDILGPLGYEHDLLERAARFSRRIDEGAGRAGVGCGSRRESATALSRVIGPLLRRNASRTVLCKETARAFAC